MSSSSSFFIPGINRALAQSSHSLDSARTQILWRAKNDENVASEGATIILGDLDGPPRIKFVLYISGIPNEGVRPTAFINSVS